MLKNEFWAGWGVMLPLCLHRIAQKAGGRRGVFLAYSTTVGVHSTKTEVRTPAAKIKSFDAESLWICSRTIFQPFLGGGGVSRGLHDDHNFLQVHRRRGRTWERERAWERESG